MLAKYTSFIIFMLLGCIKRNTYILYNYAVVFFSSMKIYLGFHNLRHSQVFKNLSLLFLNSLFDDTWPKQTL